MKTRQWLELAKFKREALKEALMQAFSRAAGYASNLSQEEVLLHDNGNITIHSYPVYDIPKAVTNGNAIYVGTIAWFDYDHWLQTHDKYPEEEALHWAEEQIQLLLQDLKYTAELEELDVAHI